ncbi:MAG: hypothetical protein KTR24_06280 [Saprospiraceae bacterium]|nr:hypothetical protein [Saprospiraceae bacterium]
MNFFSRLFRKRAQSANVADGLLLEANVCPNCWGRMEYDNQFMDYVKDQTKSNINRDKSNQKAFVQQFVETHVTGIHLKSEGDMLACPKCTGKFKKVSSKLN